jgi:UDPglucose--hexose-1-phosphate uridylyltransferase
VHVLDIVKPDGRRLTLYGREPVTDVGPVLVPAERPEAANPHLRWHPLRGEWVAYAAHRQARTFLPPPDYDPLRPGADPQQPTELPTGRYDVAVFENLFPALTSAAHDPPSLAVRTAPARGRCEVVVFTQDPDATLGTLPDAHAELLVRVWADRTRRLAREADVSYVLPFENRGTAMGVTLHHPHGQIYGYPFVPPVPARMHELESAHWASAGRTLLGELVAQEMAAGNRVVVDSDLAVAFVPAWARYPFEVWVAPREPCAFLHDLDDGGLRDLAQALQSVVRGYDRLFQKPMPYVMAWYQAPTDGRPHPGCHLHAEFLPIYRARDKLKHLAGTELAGGMFASDVLPEDAAARLRAAVADIADAPAR